MSLKNRRGLCAPAEPGAAVLSKPLRFDIWKYFFDRTVIT